MKKKTLNKRKFVAKKTVKPKEIENESGLLNMTDICLYLKVSRATITNYLRDKDLPSYKIGKALYFRKAEIDMWLNRFIN